MGASKGLFLFQNISYIMAYVLLIALACVRRRKKEQLTTIIGGGLRMSVLGLCVVRFVLAYVLIFGDSTGSGNMFSFSGVLSLFRTKGDAWVVGLWMELCTLFIVASFWLMIDAEEKGVPLALVLLFIVVGFFIAGAGFGGYVVFCGLFYNKAVTASGASNLNGGLTEVPSHDGAYGEIDGARGEINKSE